MISARMGGGTDIQASSRTAPTIAVNFDVCGETGAALVAGAEVAGAAVGADFAGATDGAVLRANAETEQRHH